jgi:hypothetical protein
MAQWPVIVSTPFLRYLILISLWLAPLQGKRGSRLSGIGRHLFVPFSWAVVELRGLLSEDDVVKRTTDEIREGTRIR